MRSAQEVAGVIESLAKQRELSINKLTAESGLSWSSFANMRKHGNMLSADRLLRLATVLGVTVEYLLVGEEKTELAQTNHEGDLHMNNDATYNSEQKRRIPPKVVWDGLRAYFFSDDFGAKTFGRRTDGSICNFAKTCGTLDGIRPEYVFCHSGISVDRWTALLLFAWMDLNEHHYDHSESHHFVNVPALLNLSEYQELKYYCNISHPDFVALGEALIEEDKILGAEKTITKHNTIFVSMWFTTPMQDLFYSLFKPIVSIATGEIIEAVRINDDLRIDTAGGGIPKKIIETIHGGRALIADLTGHRGGVYHEVGIADGVGIPVIFTCCADTVEEDVHFNINHRTYVSWRTGDIESFISLAKRIARQIRFDILTESEKAKLDTNDEQMLAKVEQLIRTDDCAKRLMAIGKDIAERRNDSRLDKIIERVSKTEGDVERVIDILEE